MVAALTAAAAATLPPAARLSAKMKFEAGQPPTIKWQHKNKLDSSKIINCNNGRHSQQPQPNKN